MKEFLIIAKKNWLFLQKHFVVGVFSWVLNILFANKNCQIKSLRELIKLSANSGYDHTILIKSICEILILICKNILNERLILIGNKVP